MVHYNECFRDLQINLEAFYLFHISELKSNNRQKEL